METQEINGYTLSRKWFNFCFDNPEKIKPIHSAIYFFAIEHCNRLGWKIKFGFPSQMVMEAIGVKNWRTYQKALNDLVDLGFIDMIEKSKNQYSSNIIAIVKNTKAQYKALDKALQKHSTKQGQSTVSIDKQLNKEQETINYIYNIYPTRCPISNRSLGKGKKSKDKIKSKLKEYTSKELEERINRYIQDCGINRTYYKDFNTLLNNIDTVVMDKPVTGNKSHLKISF